MKHGRKPTRAQSTRIKSLNLNPEHWLVCKDTIGQRAVTPRVMRPFGMWRW